MVRLHRTIDYTTTTGTCLDHSWFRIAPTVLFGSHEYEYTQWLAGGLTNLSQELHGFINSTAFRFRVFGFPVLARMFHTEWFGADREMEEALQSGVLYATFHPMTNN